MDHWSIEDFVPLVSREGVSHPRASNKAGDLETLGRLRADVVSKYELPPTVKITDEAQAANYLEV